MGQEKPIFKLTEKIKEKKRMNEEKENGGMDQAQAQLDSIVELVESYHEAKDIGEAEYEGDNLTEDELLDIINSKPLSLEVRAGWHNLGEKAGPDEYRILLSWGGPACQVIGDLDEYGDPYSAKIQGQDWYTEWKTLSLKGADGERLLDFVRCFNFSE